MRGGWMVLGFCLAGGLLGALYGASTWQDTGDDLLEPTRAGLAIIDGAYGFVFGGVIAVAVWIASDVWRWFARHRSPDRKPGAD